MNYATDMVHLDPARVGGADGYLPGTIRRSLIYLTVVAVAMIAVASAALAALGA